MNPLLLRKLLEGISHVTHKRDNIAGRQDQAIPLHIDLAEIQ